MKKILLFGFGIVFSLSLIAQDTDGDGIDDIYETAADVNVTAVNFGCTSDFYLVASSTGTSDLYSMDFYSGVNVQVGLTATSEYSGSAYDQSTDLIFVLKNGTGNVLNYFDLNGVLHEIVGTSSMTFSSSGEIDVDRNYWTTSSSSSSQLNKIDLNTMTETSVTFTIGSGSPVIVSDLSYITDGTNEYLFGVVNNNLITYNLTNLTVSSIAISGNWEASDGEYFGASFATDNNSKYYIINNYSGNVYEITDFNTASSTATKVADFIPVSGLGGANCQSASSPFSDTDGDGTPNYLDTDSDNDGIDDSVEGTTDTDGDGIPNYLDTDSDGDGTLDVNDDFPLDSTEDLDTDGDSTGDNTDTDDDGDGTLDVSDDFPLDSTEDTDTDGDGIGNNTDTDDDGDGISDIVEGTTDTDGDGILDCLDTDSDNDGIDDSVEGTTDTDGDSIPNYLDTDSDGDGISDSIEGNIDTDVDGIPNYLDLDSDGDGISDLVEGTTDTDSDGTPDCLDTDSDNDGTPDADDTFPTDSTETIDTDGDGAGDNADTDDDGDGMLDSDELICGSDPLDSTSIALDTDEDSIPDCTDSDDDNDGTPDADDTFPTDSTETIDTDGDGAGDNADTDDDGDGMIDTDELICGSDPLDSTSIALDTDEDSIPDCVDSDDDNDGISDVEEGIIDTDEDGIPNYLDTDSDGDGILDIIEGTTDSDGDGILDYLDVACLYVNSTQNVFACNSYDWNGVTYTSSGVYTDTIQDMLGCNSVIAINLTIDQPITPTIVQQFSTTLTTGNYFDYQWYRNGELMPDETNQILLIYSSGYYTVNVFNEFGCSSLSSNGIQYGQSISIEERLLEEFKIYPNPSINIAYLETPNDLGRNYVVSLYDNLGRVVLIKESNSFQSGSLIIDISSLNPSIYNLAVKYENGAVWNTTLLKQ